MPRTAAAPLLHHSVHPVPRAARVGDLHQPLHCANRNGDKGGNGRLVFFPSRKKAVTLHVVWDTLILPRSKGKQSVADYGDALSAKISEKRAKVWRPERRNHGPPTRGRSRETWSIVRSHPPVTHLPPLKSTSPRRSRSWMNRSRKPA